MSKDQTNTHLYGLKEKIKKWGVFVAVVFLLFIIIYIFLQKKHHFMKIKPDLLKNTEKSLSVLNGSDLDQIEVSRSKCKDALPLSFRTTPKSGGEEYWQRIQQRDIIEKSLNDLDLRLQKTKLRIQAAKKNISSNELETRHLQDELIHVRSEELHLSSILSEFRLQKDDMQTLLNLTIMHFDKLDILIDTGQEQLKLQDEIYINSMKEVELLLESVNHNWNRIHKLEDIVTSIEQDGNLK